jgi:hypothetical protein
MATLLKRTRLARYRPLLAAQRSDRLMTDRTMRAYLHYRLAVLEGQINELVNKAGWGDTPQPDSYWAWNALPARHEWFNAWTRLSYLLNARDEIRAALDADPDA